MLRGFRVRPVSAWHFGGPKGEAKCLIRLLDKNGSTLDSVRFAFRQRKKCSYAPSRFNTPKWPNISNALSGIGFASRKSLSCE